ncbi:MAG: mycofactocin biosynthesis peptidyl-dipeptidase MftE [Actinobacteria bacterium]|nr:MAG: mycofactocin biosynthesis peptidyl-dipeptidase MftE [Actinomycetota bacterium]
MTNQTWSQVANRDSTVLLLPLGSCEQHGPHLPLDTDTKIAQYLCAQAALQDDRILIAPSLSITASGEHAGFVGTLSIGTSALTQVLIEIVRSADWCSGVVFVNGHGGNADAVNAATHTLRDEQRNVAYWWPHIAGGDAHAGMSETSIMLAIDQAHVHMHLAEIGATQPIEQLTTQLRSSGVRAVSPNGILGDPTAATAAHGHILLSQLTQDLVTFMNERTTTWTQP